MPLADKELQKNCVLRWPVSNFKFLPEKYFDMKNIRKINQKNIEYSIEILLALSITSYLYTSLNVLEILRLLIKMLMTCL